MATTAGYGVQVMPSIQFADGAQLAGRGPGEAIAGFNSGIGLVNAIQNTRQKAILAPIEQEAARARLAQIQAETELSQANAPYRNALARIEMAKASVPIRQKTGEKIIGVNEIGADGLPTGRTHQVIQEEGFEFDPQTGARTPYSAMAKPLVTADQGSLNNSLIDSRAAAAAAQATLNEIRAGDAATRAKRVADQSRGIDNAFTLGQGKNAIAQQRADTPNFLPVTGVQDGKLVLLPFNRKSGTTSESINTGVEPNRVVDPITADIAKSMAEARARAAAGGTTTTAPAQTGGIRNWINNHNPFSSAPAVEQPVTTLPVIPVGQASANPGPPDIPTQDELSAYFNSGQQVVPAGEVQVGKFKVRQK